MEETGWTSDCIQSGTGHHLQRDLFTCVQVCKTDTARLGTLSRVTYYHTPEIRTSAEHYLRKYVETFCRYRHPNVVTVYSLDCQPGQTSLLMESPSYGDLPSYVKTHGLTWSELWEVLRDVLKGLVFLEATARGALADLQLQLHLSNIWMFRGLAKVACCGLPMADRMFHEVVSPDGALSPSSDQSDPVPVQNQGNDLYRFGLTLLAMMRLVSGEQPQSTPISDDVRQFKLSYHCPDIFKRILDICLAQGDQNCFAELYAEFQMHSPQKVFSVWDVSLHNNLVPKNQRWVIYRKQVFEYTPQKVTISNESSGDDDNNECSDEDYDGDDNDEDDNDGDNNDGDGNDADDNDGDVTHEIDARRDVDTGTSILVTIAESRPSHCSGIRYSGCEIRRNADLDGAVQISDSDRCDDTIVDRQYRRDKEATSVDNFNSHSESDVTNTQGNTQNGFEREKPCSVHHNVAEGTTCYEHFYEAALDECSVSGTEVDSGEDDFSESWLKVTVSQCNESYSGTDDNESLREECTGAEDSANDCSDEETNGDLSTCEQMTDYEENGIVHDGMDLPDDGDLYSNRFEIAYNRTFEINESGVSGKNVHISHRYNGITSNDIGFFSDDDEAFDQTKIDCEGNKEHTENCGIMNRNDDLRKTEIENDRNNVRKNFDPSEEIDLFMDDEAQSVITSGSEEGIGVSSDSDTMNGQDISENEDIVSTDAISFSDEEFSYHCDENETDQGRFPDEQSGWIKGDGEQTLEDLNEELKDEIDFFSDDDVGYNNSEETTNDARKSLSFDDDVNVDSGQKCEHPDSDEHIPGEIRNSVISVDEIGFLSEDELFYPYGQYQSSFSENIGHAVEFSNTGPACYHSNAEKTQVPYEEIGFFSEDENVSCDQGALSEDFSTDTEAFGEDKDFPEIEDGSSSGRFLNNIASDNYFPAEENDIIHSDNASCSSLNNVLDLPQKTSTMLAVGDFSKSSESNIVKIKGVSYTVGRMLGAVQKTPPTDYWSDCQKDIVILLQDIEGSQEHLSENCVLNDYRGCLLRKLNDIEAGGFENQQLPHNTDPNTRPLPVPSEIHSDPSRLRPWLNDWIPFDTGLPETGSVWQQMEYPIVSPSETEDVPENPWYGEWKPFDMSIEGETAWRNLPADVIANDLPTKQQIKVMEFRQKHKHCQDEHTMNKRRQHLGEYFQKRYGLRPELIDRYLGFVTRLKENEDELKSLADMDFSFIIV